MKRWLPLVIKWLFLVIIVFLPFLLGYLWREPVAVSYLGLFSVVLIALTFTAAVLKQLKLPTIESESLRLVLLLLTLMLLWGSLFSEPLRSILGPWVNRFLLPLGVGYVGLTLLTNNELSLDELSGALWAGLLLTGAYGILQLTSIISTNTPGRVTGSFLFPNSYARILFTQMLLLFPLLLQWRGWRLALSGLIWLLGLIALLGTQSYAGVAAFVLGLSLIIVLAPKRFRSLKIAFFVAIVTAIGVAAVFRQDLPKYQATISSSLETRQQFWHIARETIRSHPVTGIGLEGWERNYLSLARQYIDETQEPIIETVSAQPHNVFLDASLRGGMIGFFAISCLLLWPVLIGAKMMLEDQAKRSSGQLWLSLGLAGYGLAMIVFGLVDDPIFSDEAMTILFVSYFALAYVLPIKKDPA